jgi:hypothetical protein
MGCGLVTPVGFESGNERSRWLPGGGGGGTLSLASFFQAAQRRVSAEMVLEVLTAFYRVRGKVQ